MINRGVEKRKIFLTNRDYIRFIHNISDFNSVDNALQSYMRRRNDNLMEVTEVRPPSKQLVDVFCWSLLPNHPHLLVAECGEKFAGMFSRKIFGGYTMYFNENYDRSGVLFQGRSKIIPVMRDAHLLHLPFYIHSNPLDVFQPNWREDGIKNIKGAIKFLEEYRWSNYRDIIGQGQREFADASNKELFFDMFDTNKRQYQQDMIEWLKEGEYSIELTDS